IRGAGAGGVSRARRRSVQRQAEPARRGDRARPSVRHDGGAHHGHAAERPRDDGPRHRSRDDVRRRRPRDGNARRAPQLSLVALVAACGAVVPFGIALATGERPSLLALAGAGAALAGAVLASLEERRGSSPERARAVALAVVAAVALGLFVYFLGLGSREGDALSTLTGARVASLALLVALALARHAPLRVPRPALV